MPLDLHIFDWQQHFYQSVMIQGITNNARGQMTKEKLNFSCDLLPNQRLLNHNELPLAWEYLKKELIWYTNAEYSDDSIAQHAAQWDKVRNPDGFWLSNYGYWLWGPPQRLKWVIEELRRDHASRRAVVHINSPQHLDIRNNDIPCTMYMNFHVRVHRLYMTVRMRSQDAVWGLRNDLPFFWMVFDVVAKLLDIPQGTMHYSADSFHVYERHFEKVERVLQNPGGWQTSTLNIDALVDKVIKQKLSMEPRRLFDDWPPEYKTSPEESRNDRYSKSFVHVGDVF